MFTSVLQAQSNNENIARNIIITKKDKMGRNWRSYFFLIYLKRLKLSQDICFAR